MSNRARFLSTGSMATIVIMVAIIVAISCICTLDFGINAEESHEVFILMYHNIIASNETPNKYEITLTRLEEDLRRIAELRMPVILPSDIAAYKRGERTLPSRSVMLTFDDGYYSYIRYLLPLLEKYDMRAVVNVVGEYTRLNKTRHDLSKRYTYVDYEDIKTLSESGRVAIGYHSYNYHHTGGARNGAAQSKGESYDSYRARLLSDTLRLKSELQKVGVETDIYAYPYGAYSKCSDKILSEIGVKTTLSCSEGINHITRDSSTYLLRRYNRSGVAGKLEDIFPYFG